MMSARTSGLFFLSLIILPVISFSFLSASCTAKKTKEETLIQYARASNIYAQGRFGESAKILSQLKDFPPALTLKGKAEFFSNKEKDAEKSLRGALKLNPADAEASLYLARLLREKGELKEAEQVTESLLSNNPFDIRALRLAADLSSEKGHAGQAAAGAFLDRAVEASVEAALVFLDRARLRWIAGNTHGALEDLNRAKAVLPGSSPLMRSVTNLESTIKNVIYNDRAGDLQ
ncbi:MAG: tetratricopeptide repeat protein [Treponema sp.]|jgi:predicted Zn-dependent protease|nr:tetratricopeptide repeat protein [Treponema sp.]